MDAAPIIARIALPGGALPFGEGAALTAGTEFDGLLGATRDGLVLTARGHRIPLEASPGLRPGQQVHVTVRASEGGLALEIRPIDSPAAARDIAAPLRLLDRALALAGRSFQELGAEAASLAPAGLPPRQDVVQLALSLFTARSDVAGALRELATLLAPAVQSGLLSAMPSDGLLKLLTTFRGERPGDWRALLTQAAALRNDAPEAALRSGAEAPQGLRAWLDSVGSNDAVRALLRNEGTERRVLELVGQLRDRVVGLQLQQGRDTPLPYTFLEVPLPGGGPRDGAQVHLYGGRASDIARGVPVRFAVDVELSATGALWIQGEVSGRVCRCRVQVAHEHVYDVMAAEGAALESALEGLDYDDVEVRVERWMGDRTRAAAEFLAMIDGFNVTA